MDVELVLRRGLRANERQGNRLVTEILGARIHWVVDDPRIDDRTSAEPAMRAVEAAARARGRRPYMLASSFHPLAAAGYVACVLEMREQVGTTELAGRPLHLWVTSMGATHVGLALGIRWLGLPWSVTGVSWRQTPDGLPAALNELAHDTARIFGLSNPLGPDDFVTVDHGGPAYGVPGPDTWAAITRCARADGLLLDPVYTGKGMAALIAAAEQGELRDAPVVFVHTGGLPALFAYADDAIAAGIADSSRSRPEVER